MDLKKLKKIFIGTMLTVICFLCVSNTPQVEAAKRTSLSKKQIIMDTGSKYSIKDNLMKDKAGIVCKSKNKKVAKVTKSGTITAKKTGKAYIYVQSKGAKKAKLIVNVVKNCTEYTIKKGKKVKIQTVLSSNPNTASKKVTSYKWNSRNEKIVKISGKGAKQTITGRKKGTTYLEGCVSKGKSVKVLLKIKVGKPTKNIKLSQDEYSLTVGGTANLKYSVLPKSASNRKTYYEMSQPGIVSISAKGVITAISPGDVKVTIYSADGCSKTSFSVSVVAELVRTTKYGVIKGTRVNSKCLGWFGVPYGKPPVGELRWKAPQDPVPWGGILSTKEKKNKAAQASTTTTSIGTEDCLYLNIYRPNTNDTNLPVMVFLHGGSNISGSSWKSFKSFAIDANCIVVSVEYRLGAFGFLNLDALKTGNPEEDSGNFALLDIKKSLEWVRDNIYGFGGNPGNVTLSGFSAGGRNTLACVISPIMRGLFHKAICFSAGMTTCTVDEGQTSAIGKLAKILVNRGIYKKKDDAKKWLKEATNEEIKNLLYSLSTDEVACMYTYMGLKMSNAPQLFKDGYVIPSEGFDVVSTGNYSMVPMILGSTSQEFASYALSATYVDEELSSSVIKTGWKMFNMILAAKEYGSMYQSRYYVENNAERFLANPGQPPIYAYRFNWGNTVNLTSDFYSNFVGSMHGLDIDFLCGSYTSPYPKYVSEIYTDNNLQGREELSLVMRQYIGNFLRNGNPNSSKLSTWNSWNNVPGANKVMIFSATKDYETSNMSSQYYTNASIDYLMRVSLTSAQYDVIMKKVLAGRYFMPVDETTKVPDEEADNLVEEQVQATDTNTTTSD